MFKVWRHAFYYNRNMKKNGLKIYQALAKLSLNFNKNQ